MSLWTPDGERPVNRNPEPEPAATSPHPTAQSQPGASQPAGGDQAPTMTEAEEAQAREMAKELADARAQLLEADVSVVIANHAMGLYELAAIHLTAEKPSLPQARLAIDALACLVDGLSGRLGENEEVLNEALNQVRMAFVQRSGDEDEDS